MLLLNNHQRKELSTRICCPERVADNDGVTYQLSIRTAQRSITNNLLGRESKPRNSQERRRTTYQVAQPALHRDHVPKLHTCSWSTPTAHAQKLELHRISLLDLRRLLSRVGRETTNDHTCLQQTTEHCVTCNEARTLEYGCLGCETSSRVGNTT